VPITAELITSTLN